MNKLTIIYWSGTGNTEKIAKLIEQGAKESFKDVKSLNVSNASIDDVKNSEIIALGSPAMGAEVIEESEMEPFVESIEGLIKGKKVALFGSYGWGTGEWMETWAERMNSAGAKLIDEGLIINESPEGDDEEKCINYGKKIVQ